jgi:serine/threonine-protein kinase
LPFASPEQIAGRELDHRSDIYSLACTLYVMLTGSVPFPRDSQIAVMHAHLVDPPPRVSLGNPSLPTQMDDVIARAMAKEPEHRYRSCRELASAAQAALSRSGGEAGPGRATILDWDASSHTHPNSSNFPVTQPNSVFESDRAATVLGGGLVSSADLADTIVPDYRAPAIRPDSQFTSPPTALAHAVRRRRSKRGIVIGAAVLAVIIGLGVVGRLAFGGGQAQHTPMATTSSATSAESTAAHTGPWQAYDFVANALPGLMPDTPTSVSYQGGSCQAINARFDPIDQLETGVPIARIMCRPKGVQSRYIANYIVICSSDRTPQTLAGVADGLTAVRNEQWSRAGGSGQIIYGDHNGAGALAISFDSPSRNFCSVVANGNDGTSGQDVYDHWFRDAPL